MWISIQLISLASIRGPKNTLKIILKVAFSKLIHPSLKRTIR